MCKIQRRLILLVSFFLIPHFAFAGDERLSLTLSYDASEKGSFDVTLKNVSDKPLKLILNTREVEGKFVIQGKKNPEKLYSREYLRKLLTGLWFSGVCELNAGESTRWKVKLETLVYFRSRGAVTSSGINGAPIRLSLDKLSVMPADGKGSTRIEVKSNVLVVGEEQPPNIVFILSDDQAWTDYGFMEHEAIKTPYLDKLAQQSMVFERGYVGSPVCRPSLATMVTGRYPSQHGITANDVDGRNKRAELDKPFRAAFHKFPSFIKLLTSNGYLAHQSGKWWEGSYQDGGFTHGMTHGDPKRGGRHGDKGLEIGRKGLKPVTDFIDMAVTEKKPFLLWYAPFLPHTPHNPPARLLEKYQKPGRAKDVARYYAMCEWFDETCGELLGYLDKKKLTEKTIVIYICDNGWLPVSTNAADPNQKKWKNYALRSKGAPYENGIRSPIMISWQGKVKASRVSEFAHAIDIFPTIAAAAKLKPPEHLSGINLLDEKARAERKIIFGVNHSTHNMTLGDPDSTLQYLWCIAGDWKLLLRQNGKDSTVYKNLHVWDTAPFRLYNLKEDPHEQKDLASEHPKIAEQLKKKIEDWHQAEKKH